MTTSSAISTTKTRKEYERAVLSLEELNPDPVLQFERWFNDAVRESKFEPNAMCLATVDEAHRPSIRMVLLKTFGADGFVFCTNYNSRKGKDLIKNPFGALLFYWPELERQVRIEGQIEKCSPEESDSFFNGRPLGSRIAAMVSQQSEPIASKATLEEEWKKAIEFAGAQPPKRPDYWGGYRLIAHQFEFWQGGKNRLHDRFVYELTDLSWQIERLQP